MGGSGGEGDEFRLCLGRLRARRGRCHRGPPPPTAAFAAAAQHGSASTPALDPWDGMHRTSGHMPTTSATDKWLNALMWGAKGSAPLADDEADCSYRRLWLHARRPRSSVDGVSLPINRGSDVCEAVPYLLYE